jgi:hypothetical protein
MLKENVPDDQIETYSRKQFLKIRKHVQSVLSTADAEALQIKFVYAMDDEITTALMADELSDYATWIN